MLDLVATIKSNHVHYISCSKGASSMNIPLLLFEEQILK
uniref:Uncharacterized protein n=1 Tax=Rhizophora mucronata TaxID=61149 RepID=A0A2P2MT54_RHIMU